MPTPILWQCANIKKTIVSREENRKPSTIKI